MKCQKCQHDNPPNAKFCRECGAKLSLVCPECSHEIDPQDKFCMECGAKIDELTSPIQHSIPKLEDLHAQLKDLSIDMQGIFSQDEIASAENRPITALFADISGFTALSATQSSENIFQMVQNCFRELGGIIKKYDGIISGYRGDGFLALFGVPLHENDAERAILAGIEIRKIMRKQNLEVSIGINTAMMTVGEIQSQLHSEYTAYGTGINLSARLQQSAQPGQILVGAGTYRLTRFAFDFEPTQPMQLKGFAESVVAYEVKQMKAHPEKLRGIEGLRAMMIGREREFADLKELADNLLSGRGNIASIIGEAGLGKSRLVAELREYINVGTQNDLLLLEGRSVSIGQTVSYWVFLDILRSYLNLNDDDNEVTVIDKLKSAIADLFPRDWKDILPFFGRLLSIRLGDESDKKLSYFTPDQIRHQTLTVLKHFFSELSRRKPLLLIFEDLHWSDDLSLDLISSLMDDVMTNPIMLLCVYRPERGHRCWLIGDSASRKCPDRYTEITLKRLSSVQSYQLVESLLQIENLPEATKEVILSKSEGNPFFIEEVIRWLIEHDMVYNEGGTWKAKEEIKHIDVPDTIQNVLLARVDRLEAETKYILQCASVIGRLFRYRLLDHLSEHQRDLERHLSQLEERELIHEERTVPELEYAFKHVLTQEATYQSILERKRKDFHLRIAGGIESLYRDQLEKFYEELAHHYSISGNDEKAIEYLLKAGIKLADSYSNQKALECLNQAEALLDKSPKPYRIEKATLYEKRGEVLQWIGQWVEALKDYEKALQFYDDPYCRAEVYRKWGWLECEEIQDKISGRKRLELGLKELPENDKSIIRIKLEQDWVWQEWHKDFSKESLEKIVNHCQEIIKIAEEMGYKQEQAILYAYQTVFYHRIENYQRYQNKQTEPSEKFSIFYEQKAISMAEELYGNPKMAWVYYLVGLEKLDYISKIYDQGITYILRSIEIAEQTGNSQQLGFSYGRLGVIYSEIGQDEKAIESYEKLLNIAEKTKSIDPLLFSRFLMNIYKKQGKEDMVISTFSRIMRSLASLEIDEESQARVLVMEQTYSMDQVYEILLYNLQEMKEKTEIPHLIQEILENLLKEVNSRPQQAWYHFTLMKALIEQKQMESAKLHAKKTLSIIDNMKFLDYMLKFYPAYLVLGDVEKGNEIALNHLRRMCANLGYYKFLYRWFGIAQIYLNYGYKDCLKMLSEKVQQEMSEIIQKDKISHLLPELIEFKDAGLIQFLDQFDEKLCDGWQWINPAGDCDYELNEKGLQINIRPERYLWMNTLNAPRLLREISEDFVIETKVSHNFTDRTTGGTAGGLLIWQDEGNYIRIGENFFYFYEDYVPFISIVDNKIFIHGWYPRKGEYSWLRIKRDGERFTAYFSDDGENWQVCGWADVPLGDIIQVGILASNYTSSPSSTRFEYFKIYKPFD